jgi:hypothetical protein
MVSGNFIFGLGEFMRLSRFEVGSLKIIIETKRAKIVSFCTEPSLSIYRYLSLLVLSTYYLTVQSVGYWMDR